MNYRILSTTVLAGLLAASGAAMAQNPGPLKPSDSPASREAVRAEARAQVRNPANSQTAVGEASTTVNHQPNMMPQPISNTTRQEVRQETLKVKPRFGDTKGERPSVPTNPKNSTGTPD